MDRDTSNMQESIANLRTKQSLALTRRSVAPNYLVRLIRVADSCGLADGCVVLVSSEQHNRVPKRPCCHASEVLISMRWIMRPPNSFR